MTLADVIGRPPAWIVAPLFLLAPTMLGYTLLWYGFYLPGIRRLFGDSKVAAGVRDPGGGLVSLPVPVE